MIRKLIRYIRFLKKVSIFQFFYLNYFCKSIIRIDNSKIIPYKNTVIDLSRSAKIYLGNGDIEIGCNLFKKSKTETRVRLRETSIWSSFGGCQISYGSTLEILSHAVFDSGYFTMNSNSVIVVGNKVVFGKDIMIARNVTILDSDFHTILYEEKNRENKDGIKIDNHVWIGANATLLKNVKIGRGAVISANTVVTKDIERNTLIGNNRAQQVLRYNVYWER